MNCNLNTFSFEKPGESSKDSKNARFAFWITQVRFGNLDSVQWYNISGLDHAGRWSEMYLGCEGGWEYPVKLVCCDTWYELLWCFFFFSAQGSVGSLLQKKNDKPHYIYIYIYRSCSDFPPKMPSFWDLKISNRKDWSRVWYVWKHFFFADRITALTGSNQKLLKEKLVFFRKYQTSRELICHSLSLSLSTYIYALQGAKSIYPTKREVRKIIDSKGAGCRINRG